MPLEERALHFGDSKIPIGSISKAKPENAEFESWTEDMSPTPLALGAVAYEQGLFRPRLELCIFRLSLGFQLCLLCPWLLLLKCGMH
jgi:hypothetical protein